MFIKVHQRSQERFKIPVDLKNRFVLLNYNIMVILIYELDVPLSFWSITVIIKNSNIKVHQYRWSVYINIKWLFCYFYLYWVALCIPPKKTECSKWKIMHFKMSSKKSFLNLCSSASNFSNQVNLKWLIFLIQCCYSICYLGEENWIKTLLRKPNMLRWCFGLFLFLLC